MGKGWGGVGVVWVPKLDLEGIDILALAGLLEGKLEYEVCPLVQVLYFGQNTQRDHLPNPKVHTQPSH